MPLSNNFFLYDLFHFLDMLGHDNEFIEQVILSLARLESSSIATAAFKMYQKWVVEEKVIPFNLKFGMYDLCRVAFFILNFVFFCMKIPLF